VVRLAQAGAPQRVSVRGNPAVVVLAAAEYARLVARSAAPDLLALMSVGAPGRWDSFPEPIRESGGERDGGGFAP
jgi:prevent-host-death family protein